jgi:hypothetical protein
MNGAHAPARAHAVRGQEQLNEQGGENDREMTGGDGTEHMRGPVPALALNVQLWPPCPALRRVRLSPSCAWRQCTAREVSKKKAQLSQITRRQCPFSARKMNLENLGAASSFFRAKPGPEGSSVAAHLLSPTTKSILVKQNFICNV